MVAQQVGRAGCRILLSAADRPCGGYTYGTEQPLPYFQPEAERTPYGFAEDGDFSDAYGDAPYTRGPGWEEPEIAGAQASLFAVLVRDEDLAGNHHNNFVLTVTALEAARRAFPHDNVGRQVVAPHNLPGPCHGNTAYNPTG